MSPAERRKQYLINKLSKLDYWYVRNLDKLTLAELEAMHIRVMCEGGQIWKWRREQGNGQVHRSL